MTFVPYDDPDPEWERTTLARTYALRTDSGTRWLCNTRDEAMARDLLAWEARRLEREAKQGD